jgi:hypothetical protein
VSVSLSPTLALFIPPDGKLYLKMQLFIAQSLLKPMSLTSITGILFVITLIGRNWVELNFTIDPDQGNGSLA